jgi:Zn-dependent peptidase ImmA (M78 family)/transcriptional regulator with XRE-family HTH domain
VLVDGSSEQGSRATLLGTVRVARGLTQTHLAQRVGISQGLLSKAESGLVVLDEERLARLSTALNVPAELIASPAPGVEPYVFHRKRSSLPISKANQVRALLVVTHLHVAGILGDAALDVRLPRIPIPEDGFDGPDDIARQVRDSLGLPAGPILDLLGALEGAGVVVVRRALGTTRIDAVVSWPAGSSPVVVLADHAPADRMRFSLAHELGHAVMHQVPTEDQESEADRFASELLMPAAYIRSSLEQLTIPRLAALKSEWGVSMAALLRRGRDLGTISEARYRALVIEMSRAGYRKTEPVVLEPEEPKALRHVIEARLGAGETLADIAAHARMDLAEFTQLYAGVDSDH